MTVNQDHRRRIGDNAALNTSRGCTREELRVPMLDRVDTNDTVLCVEHSVRKCSLIRIRKILA